MATRTARRGLGARVAMVIGVMSLALSALPGHALSPPALHDASTDTGWAGNTILVPHGPPCSSTDGARCFDINDPPYKWADGRIEYLVARWNKTLCSATTTVTDFGGYTVAGSTAILPYNGRPDRLSKFTVADTLRYPHGLAAGREDGTGGGAPFTVAYTVTHRDPNGVCNPTLVTVTQIFGIDRVLPPAPAITTPSNLITVFPSGWGGCSNIVPDPPRNTCNSFFGADPIGIAAPQSGPTFNVKGTASDPLTKPDDEDGNDYGWLETSGVAAVVVRLYAADFLGTDPFGLCLGICPGAFQKSYTIPYACTSTHILTALVPRCAPDATFDTGNISADLFAGDWFALDAYTLDLAGYRNAVSSDAPVNTDNQNGPESKSRAFLWEG